MASNAIGDIESLLEGSGIEDKETISFEEKIRKLVLDSLAGKDSELDKLKIENSIQKAKDEMLLAQDNMDNIFGKSEYFIDGPISPNLPKQMKSLSLKDLVTKTLLKNGAVLSNTDNNLINANYGLEKFLINFDENKINDVSNQSVLYTPVSNEFSKLINHLLRKPYHQVKDRDNNFLRKVNGLSKDWVCSFSGNYKTHNIKNLYRSFEGKSLLRVRATTAHDSYERLIEVDCDSKSHIKEVDKNWGLNPIGEVINDVEKIGIDKDQFINSVILDDGISEFCKFYINRKELELNKVGDDLIMKKRIEDDFTPRLSITLVGLSGSIKRKSNVEVIYDINNIIYKSNILITPSEDFFEYPQNMILCNKTKNIYPQEALNRSDIDGLFYLSNLLIESEITKRKALFEQSKICSYSGKRVLQDEVEILQTTGLYVASSFIRKSVITSKKGIIDDFVECEFTNEYILKEESRVSEISGKLYRQDQEEKSYLSNKKGHISEFVFCDLIQQPVLLSECTQCELTGKIVISRLIEVCEVTGKKVISSELDKSDFSQKKALKKFFVISSISNLKFLEIESIQSSKGNFCLKNEANRCMWSGKLSHPEDLRMCYRTGLVVYFEYINSQTEPTLSPLLNLFNTNDLYFDCKDLWIDIIKNLPKSISQNNTKIVSSFLSPDKTKLAVILKTESFMGLIVKRYGLIYSIGSKSFIGGVMF